MKTILQNLVSLIRHFKNATLLNILGLSFAFTVFIVLMMQVTYDWGYDRFHKDAKRIYRLEYKFDGKAYAVLPRPVINEFIASSPHIKLGTLIKKWDNKRNVVIEVNDVHVGFMEFYQEVYPSYPGLFNFEMIDGDKFVLEDPDKVIIPESMANKFFPGLSAVGKFLISDELKAEIGGVYKDLPENSMIGNAIYKKIDDNEGKDNWYALNYECYVLVDQPKNISVILNNFRNNFNHASFDWEKADLRLTNLSEIYYLPDIIFDSQISKGNKVQVFIILCIALLVIFIAVINFTNFSNALVPVRLKSISTQKILGCPTYILRLSLLVEGVIISLISYFISLCFIYFLSNTAFAHTVNGGIDMNIYRSLIIWTGLFSVCVGLLAGSWPAYYITSFSPLLSTSGIFGLSKKGKRIRNMLVGIQFVSSYVLIIGTIFTGLQNYYMLNSSLGFDQEQIAVLKLNKKLSDNTEIVCSQLKVLSGIEEVATVDKFPGSGDIFSTNSMIVNGENKHYKQIYSDPSILTVLGINVTEGRSFVPSDKNGENIFIYNETAKKELNLEIGGNIIGFMDDIKYNSYRNELGVFAFSVGGSFGNSIREYALIRTHANINYNSLIKSIRKVLIQIDPDYPMEISLYDEILNNLYNKELILSRQISFFAVCVILLSLIGVFGVVLFESEYKRREIGIRKVFGSTLQEILILLNHRYLFILCSCFIISVPIAWLLTSHWLKNFIHKVPISWWVFALAFIMITFLTLLTVTFQNWRIANTNPVDSIKTD